MAGSVVALTRDAYLARAATLTNAASTRAREGSGALATTLAWASDLSIAQAALTERAGRGAGAFRGYLRSSELLYSRLRAEAPKDGNSPPESAADVIQQARARMRSAAEPGLQRILAQDWGSVEYLTALPAPLMSDLRAVADERLSGMSASAFASARRSQARDLMSQAQKARIAGLTADAISRMYQSDLANLEAYLVDSAVAVNDHLLMTVSVRWELISAAIASIPGLPESVAAATTRLRETMALALGPADGARLRTVLAPV